MNLDRLWLRFSGLVVLLVCIAFYDPAATGWLHRLLLPVIMALGAWALVQNAAAVAIGVAVLAAVHSDLRSPLWVERIAYPLLALAATLVLAGIGVQRFRRRIAETHEARWSERRPS